MGTNIADDGQALAQLYETMDYLVRQMRERNKSYKYDESVVEEIEGMMRETQARINQYWSNVCDDPMIYMEVNNDD